MSDGVGKIIPSKFSKGELWILTNTNNSRKSLKRPCHNFGHTSLDPPFACLDGYPTLTPQVLLGSDGLEGRIICAERP